MSYYAIPVSNPASPSPNLGFVPYTTQSFGMGLNQLGGALSNDAAGILDWGAGVLGVGNPANQAAAQAAIAANPGLIDPTSPDYAGAFVGPGGTAPGLLQEPGMLLSDLFGSGGSGIPSWMIAAGIIAALVIFSPTLNAAGKKAFS